MKIAWLTKFFLGLVLLLAPLKFGFLMLETDVAASLPENGREWLVFSWSPSIAFLLIGLALFLSLCTCPLDWLSLSRKHYLLFLPLLGLVAVSLMGFIKTTEWNNALLFFAHILMVFAFFLAMFIVLVSSSSNWHIPFFLTCMILGTLASALWGMEQYFIGYEETMAFLQKEGANVSDPMYQELVKTLTRKHISSFFANPNMFAAHLILVIPLAFWGAWQWAKKVEPVRVSQYLFSMIIAVLLLGSLMLTGSRGALLAIILSSSIFLLFLIVWTQVKRSRFQRQHLFFLLLGITLITCIVLPLLKNKGLGIESFKQRIHYYRAAVEMLRSSPITGVGLGEFFPYYMRLKPPGAGETRLPHNIILNFAAQCGILGGIAACYFFLQPLLLGYWVYQNRLSVISPSLWISVLIGSLAWSLHALLDFTVYIPGTLLTLGILPLLALDLRAIDRPVVARKWYHYSLFILSLIIAILLFLVGLWYFRGQKSYQSFSQFAQHASSVHELKMQTILCARDTPLSPYPWKILADFAMSRRDYKTACSAYEEASKRAPHQAYFYRQLAWCFLAQKEFGEANDYRRLAFQWDPYHPDNKKLSSSISKFHP